MKKLLTLIATLALSASVAAPVAASAADQESGMLTLINDERAANGLSPLSVYADLVDDAQAHSALMKSEMNLHHNPNLGDVTTGWHALGENVGVGPEIVALHGAFMASPGHRANIMGDYNYIGIGVEEDGPSRIWITVVFMRAPAEMSPPPPAEVSPPAPAETSPPAPAETSPPTPAEVSPPTPPAALPADATQVGLVDPGSGIWYLRDHDGAVSDFYFGNPGDYPMLGDWDCDGVATPGLYRQSDGYVYLRNSNTQGIADIRFYFGNPNDVPLAGDFDGDGCDTVSVYRPSESTVFVINRLGADEAGLGAADYSFAMGGVGQTVVTGDFNGDGVDTATVAAPGSVAGDWDCDGTATIGRFDDGVFSLGDGLDYSFGTPGWLPVSGHTG